MKEVINYYQEKVDKSEILKNLKVEKYKYFCMCDFMSFGNICVYLNVIYDFHNKSIYIT